MDFVRGSLFLVSVCKGTHILAPYEKSRLKPFVKICKRIYGLIEGVTNVTNVTLVFLKIHII